MGSISSCEGRGIVTLLRKDSNEEDMVECFGLISLLNTELKTLAKAPKVFGKRPVFVVGGIAGDTQTCAITGRSIPNNLPVMRYSVDGVGNRPGFGEHWSIWTSQRRLTGWTIAMLWLS